MSTPSPVPTLLPFALPQADSQAWAPSKYLGEPQPPPPDLERLAQEAAAQRAGMDPRAIKKVKPRRTVDYGGELGRWRLVSTLERFSPNLCSCGHQHRKMKPGSALSTLRPAPTYIVDVSPSFETDYLVLDASIVLVDAS